MGLFVKVVIVGFGILGFCYAADSIESSFTPSYVNSKYKAPIYNSGSAPAHIGKSYDKINRSKAQYNGAYFKDENASSFTPSYIKDSYKRPVLSGQNAPTHLGKNGDDYNGAYTKAQRDSKYAQGSKENNANNANNRNNAKNVIQTQFGYTLNDGQVSQNDIDSLKREYSKQGYMKSMQSNIVASSLGFDLPYREEPKNLAFVEKREYNNRGYQSLEQVLQYSPFVTFMNSGFGNNIDLRGQGPDSARAVKLLINRVPISLLDTSHGVPAYNNIDIEDVESIEIVPGGGAILYGSGTRGGVLNITTKMPSRDFARAAIKGISGEKIGLQGGLISAAFGKKIADSFFIRASLGGGYTGGVRNAKGDFNNAFINDNITNAYGAFQMLYEINENQKLDFNINYAHLWTSYPQTYLSLTDIAGKQKDSNALQNERNNPSPYTTKTQTDSMMGSLNYTYSTDNLKMDAMAFYQFSFVKYQSIQDRPVAIKTGANTSQNFTISSDAGKNRFQNRAGGLTFRIKYDTNKNMFIAGLDSILEYSIRTDYLYGVAQNNVDNFYSVEINNNALKFTNSLYALNKYNITDSISITAGARLEYSNYSITNNQYAYFNELGNFIGAAGAIEQDYKFNTKKNYLGYAFELTPSYKYSDSGSVFIKGELGFINPSPFQLISTETGNLTLCEFESIIQNCAQIQIDRNVLRKNIASDIRLEQYATGELGIKDNFNIGDSSVYGSITLFYTHTFNEIYANSVAHGTIYTYGNLGQTQRAGIEILSRQRFFPNQILRMQQSIAGLYSNILESNISNAHLKGEMVPYAPWLKATFNIEADVFRSGRQFITAFMNNAYISQSIDTTAILESNLTDSSVSLEFTSATIAAYNPSSHVINKGGYVLSDVGIIYGAGDFRFNTGVRNIFNSYYVTYQKYPNISPAMGRTYYAEIRYSF